MKRQIVILPPVTGQNASGTQNTSVLRRFKELRQRSQQQFLGGFFPAPSQRDVVSLPSGPVVEITLEDPVPEHQRTRSPIDGSEVERMLLSHQDSQSLPNPVHGASIYTP